MTARSDRPTDLAQRQQARVVARRELDRKNQTAVVKMRTEVLEHADRWALLSDVRAQERRGYVRPLQDKPKWNFTMGVWEMRVVRLKQPPSRAMQIAKPFALVFFPLAAFVGVVWWFLLSLTATALIGLCGVAFLLLAGVVTVTHRSGSRTIDVVQRVTIRGR